MKSPERTTPQDELQKQYFYTDESGQEIPIDVNTSTIGTIEGREGYVVQVGDEYYPLSMRMAPSDGSESKQYKERSVEVSTEESPPVYEPDDLDVLPPPADENWNVPEYSPRGQESESESSAAEQKKPRYRKTKVVTSLAVLALGANYGANAGYVYWATDGDVVVSPGDHVIDMANLAKETYQGVKDE